MSKETTDPYKYFQKKFKNQTVGQDSDSDLSEDSKRVDLEGDYSQQEDEYSLNNDEDFQLSASLKKSEGANQGHKASIEARERL